MAAAQVPNEKLGNPKSSRRRRKKRRTEDFSSDESSSSSSSDSDNDKEEEIKGSDNIENGKTPNIDDIDIDSDDEKITNNKNETELLSQETQKQINEIKFTSNTLNSNNTTRTAEEIKQTVDKDRNDLESQFLGLMASNFSDDLDELRKKPDFTDKSLVMLAKVLQSGSNIFDEDSLDALIKN
ncbi:hypothetical protein HYPBUDRAFT_153171 [Hyphopichia burtonii NRRL Y-1933]|uniref:Ribosome assembly protein 3 n=1 Tax=Hyphopichia burtonii NRRL Y-1933 TaxID=984485 RepID=A0A1E4RJ94_9ASCO|nr:hypothetical protein HYPBUDRAFT_153171 [Hyphopichia burtonii NRRL Y-1933]ODV67348.1 hypothetical protein HYPBUDRAFT_153171 [Hyphopichia burtonii NRRL Y-1933]